MSRVEADLARGIGATSIRHTNTHTHTHTSCSSDSSIASSARTHVNTCALGGLAVRSTGETAAFPSTLDPNGLAYKKVAESGPISRHLRYTMMEHVPCAPAAASSQNNATHSQALIGYLRIPVQCTLVN